MAGHRPPGIDNFANALQRVPVPPEDRTLSPYTGLTRQHWIAAADDLLLSAARYASPGRSRIDLPGRMSQQGVRADGLEGFARTFLLAAFRHVGATASGDNPAAGDDPAADPHGHLARYRDGLVAGPRHPGRDDADSWPLIGHVGRHGQSQVEAASIALSLHLTRVQTWDRLTAAQRDRLSDWLRTGLFREPSSNNWYLFPMTVASFLEAVGYADHQTTYVIERGLSLLDQWYRGDGWYSDGDGDAFDHYVGWALHLYPMLHAHLRGDEPLAERLGRRLRLFLDSFARTFDRNGAPLHYGRSLTYRMATLASVALGEVTGYTPLRPGQSRRILSAGLRYFLERGATADGILTLGWHGPHPPTLQRYSGPGSPYWASKGFAALMLPAEHPLWTVTEEEPDWEWRDDVRVIAPAGLLVQRTGVDGLVRVHNHGSDHLKPNQADDGPPDPLYSRFAYSTRTGPTALHNPSDNDVQLNVRDVWSVRRRIHLVASGDNWVASWHAPRFPVYSPHEASPDATGGPLLPSVRIDSVVAVHGSVEVRVHRLVNVPPGTPVRLSGWAAAGVDVESVCARAAGGHARVTAGPLVSRLLGVHGWQWAGSAVAPYGTAYGPWAAVPELHGVAYEGIFVALASLDTTPAGGGDLASAVSVEVDGERVRIRWAGGRVDTVLDLASIYPA